MSIPTRRDRKRQAAHDEIVHLAAALFAEHGFAAVTMEQIAAAADIAKATLYSHFPTKDALAAALVRASIRSSAERLPALLAAPISTAERLHAVFDTLPPWLMAHRDIMPAYLRHRFQQLAAGDQDAPRSGFGDVLTAILSAGQAAGDVRTDMAAIDLSHSLQLLFLGLAMASSGETDLDALHRRFRQTVTLFLEGIGPTRQGAPT